MDDTGDVNGFHGEQVVGCLLLSPTLNHDPALLASYEAVDADARAGTAAMTEVERFGVADNELNCWSVGVVMGDGTVYVQNYASEMVRRFDGALSTVGLEEGRRLDVTGGPWMRPGLYEWVTYPGLTPVPTGCPW